ncbi:MAG: phosphoribosylamine--glycine ligase [bacterium]|nr:phosphoribosylamine--glycine ligase [bacterium]MDZ4342318.1 phosphoribosylamine--glycine ligase [Candidatus Binatia bacterium]
MKTVLVIGSGGREAAIVKKLCQDATVGSVVCSPGSTGIRTIGPKVTLFPWPADPDHYRALIDFAKGRRVDLTVVGPETPLVDGIVDAFREAGLRIVGPTKSAARLEGSKVFCKELLRDNHIPTADFQVFDNPQAAFTYIRKHDLPVVVKADGLAAGKGVTVAHTEEEATNAINQIMILHQFGRDAGRRVVIEDYLQGRECSMIALIDDKDIIPLITAQDYKPAFDCDQGPNTGGMGCYSPVPFCTPIIRQKIISDILFPTTEAMKKLGAPYTGVLYAGLMLTKDGPKVLEFNCRFGDPETQAILALMNPDVSFMSFLEATTNGTLYKLPSLDRCGWQNKKAVCVVLAAPGYPGIYTKGLTIRGIEKAEALGVSVLHAGTARSKEGDYWVTNGGRVLNLITVGETFAEARDSVYTGVWCITFNGATPHHRTDIALCVY